MPCPFSLDVAGLTERVAKRNFAAAYRLLREQLLFPDIVCAICERPCEGECLRAGIDGPIRIGMIEAAAVEYGGGEPGKRYRVPRQGKKVAVVGGGLAGASCASLLAAAGYETTLYEAEKQIGGRLKDIMPEEEYLRSLLAGLDSPLCEIVCGRHVADTEKLHCYDAVIIADGRTPGESPSKAPKGVFFCRLRDGAMKAQPVAEAMDTVRLVQSWLKTGIVRGTNPPGANNGDRPAYFGFLQKLYEGEPVAERISGAHFAPEDAAEEAALCLTCRCDACRRACDYMRSYNMLPRRLLDNVRMNLNPMQGMKAHMATRMIFSCNACGRCADVCPEDIDMGDVMLLARSLMQREGDVPPVFHDYWMRDMAHANSDACSFAGHAPGRDRSARAFFPGCQLGAAAPGLVKKAYGRLLSLAPDTGLILRCCGAIAMWAGYGQAFKDALLAVKQAWLGLGRPELILSCPTCRKVFAKHLPEISTVSLYTLLAGYGAAGKDGARQDTAANSDAVFAVFDPCAAHSDAEAKGGVRRLLAESGYGVREIPEHAAGNGCCGFGGLIYPANPELYSEIASRRAASSELPMATYCVNCRDILRRGGKQCRHVLELVLDGAATDGPLAAPSLTQRHDSREALKKSLSASFLNGGTEIPHIGEAARPLTFAEGIQAKMDTLLLLEGEIADVIESSKRGNAVLRDGKTGFCCGHGIVGRVTCWVMWQETENGYHIENVYSHRMAIGGVRM
jgi:Fe-S oxidoreductase